MTKITPEYLASQGLSVTFPARFFANVNITESCWFWTGSRRTKGMAYANACRGVWVNGTKTILAHKASWLLHFGPIPGGLCVCHDCPDGDCPWCVNPAHLWLGTHRENNHDMFQKGRDNPCGGVYHSGEENRTSKLTNEQADNIRRLYKPFVVSMNDLARKFGIARPNVSRILRGVSYRHEGMASTRLSGKKLTEEQEREIREWYARGTDSQQAIANHYGVSQVHVSHIVRRSP